MAAGKTVDTGADVRRPRYSAGVWRGTGHRCGRTFGHQGFPDRPQTSRFATPDLVQRSNPFCDAVLADYGGTVTYCAFDRLDSAEHFGFNRRISICSGNMPNGCSYLRSTVDEGQVLLPAVCNGTQTASFEFCHTDVPGCSVDSTRQIHAAISGVSGSRN